METPRTWRRCGVALVLTAVLGLAPMAPVVAAPLVSFDLLTGSSHFWAKAWGFFQGRWTKEGSSISPNGTPVEGGSEIDPNGAAIEEGGSISPDGHTKEGGSISPNG